MMKWHVKLPAGKQLWLKSDNPDETLQQMGYTEYALTDVRAIPKQEIPKNVKWVTSPPQKGGVRYGGRMVP